MYTQSEFEKAWREQYHFNGIDASSTAPYYYSVYQQLYKLIERKPVERGNDNDFYILEILWYIEDSASIWLSKSYETIYRLAKDTVHNYLTLLELNGRERNKALSIIGNAIASAPESGLVRWVIDSVNSQDFNQLKNVALYYYDKVACLKGMLVYEYGVRENVFSQMFGRENARKFILSDLSFNWRDKEGKTILHRLGECLESKGYTEVANSLKSILPVKLDCFAVDSLDGWQAAFHSKRKAYAPVIFNSLPAQSNKTQCFMGQLVGWNGKYYVNGPAMWFEKRMYDHWNADKLWNAIEEDIAEAATGEFYEDADGNEYSLLEDLYGKADNPVDYKIDNDMLAQMFGMM
jgi:hypothetical protein